MPTYGHLPQAICPNYFRNICKSKAIVFSRAQRQTTQLRYIYHLKKEESLSV